jgi:hypothetical protein
MSETVELYKAMGDHRKALRAKYGKYCPECVKRRPRAHPSCCRNSAAAWMAMWTHVRN